MEFLTLLASKINNINFADVLKNISNSENAFIYIVYAFFALIFKIVLDFMAIFKKLLYKANLLPERRKNFKKD